jgi:cytoskeletal protein RodZ
MLQNSQKHQDGVSDQEPVHTDPAAARGVDIGGSLRRRREDLNLELSSVATTLRIRREYLAALENNTIQGLPGPTYTTGFLRTYADYLGLDGEEVVRRFKSGQASLYDKTELTFPMPLTERGIPGGGLFLLTVIILIGLGYGTWYYISSSKHATLDAVEPVPAQLAPLAATAPAAPAPVAPPPVAVATPAAPAAVPPAAKPAPANTTAQTPAAPTLAPAASGTAPQAAAVPPTTVPAQPPTAPASTANGTGGDTGTLPADTQNDLAGTDAMPQQPAGSAAPAAPTAAAPDAASTAAAATPAVAPPTTGRTYGAAKPTHIVVKAIGSSWVQVRDAQDKVLTMRVMKPGDTYNAPDQPGLVMRTGNAGALMFVVDGKNLPPLGRIGEVKQHIRLDPAQLTQGTADQ